MKLRAMRGTVLVDEITKGERMFGSIILRNDNGKLDGIRPRWCRVYAVGEDITDIKAGDWILVKHGNWTRSMDVELVEGEGLQPLWAINWPDGALVVSDEPAGDTWASDPGVGSIHDK
jgi:hypothetical protein